MMEYFNLVERRGLFDDGDYESEDEYLWPSEVREEIIHPNIETSNATVTVIVEEQDTAGDDEEQLSVILPVSDAEISTSLSDKEHTTGVTDEPTSTEVISTSPVSSDTLSSSSSPVAVSPVVTTESPSLLPTEIIDPEEEPAEETTVESSSSSSSSSTQEEVEPQTEQVSQNTTIVEESPTMHESEEANSNATTTATIGAITSTPNGVTATSQVSSLPSTAAINESTAASGRKPASGHKDSYTQESIYKNIMKRLNALELNATLSQRYLDEQNKMLNDVFMNMEQRHQDQIILLLGRLNDTASNRIDGMVCYCRKRRLNSFT